MRAKYGWLVALLAITLLVAACGPEMATPTPQEVVAVVDTPADPPTEAVEEEPQDEAPATTATEAQEDPTEESESGQEPVGPAQSDDWHILGSPDAPVTIVDFSDFQWPYCAKYVRETFPQILETYVDTGKVQYIYKNFPLYSIHPQAARAAEAAECGGEQGVYWEMHEAVFEAQGQWSGADNPDSIFVGLAEELGLDADQFEACLDEGRYADRVTADYQEGVSQGVTGTPAFFVNGTPMSGAQPFGAFAQQIEFYLAGGETPSLKVDADSYRSLGRADAPVVITEFSDYQWPACQSIAREVIPDLIEQYVDTGKARFVYREFPLTSIHPAAQSASEAAICAGEQGKYWEMNEHLFDSVAEWSAGDPTDFVYAYAGTLGLDVDAFKECLDSGQGATVVQSDLLAGEMAGVNATPYFFINDMPIRGGLPVDLMGQIIDYVAAGGETPEIVPAPGDPRMQGDVQTAQILTVAFVDYASPDSAQHAREVLPLLVDDYIDTGQLVYILHPWADGMEDPGFQAAAAAECAGQQGQYWEMHGSLFDDQDAWLSTSDPAPVLEGYADTLGLDTAEFAECLVSDWAKLRVQSGNVVGALYGVPGAPVFLFSTGSAQEGSPSLEEFKSIIDAGLNQ